MRHLPTVVAVLCVLAALPWALGVPGVENAYARGWMIGFASILLYPLAIVVIGLAGLALRWAGIETGALLPGLRFAALAAFAAAQAAAWTIMAA